MGKIMVVEDDPIVRGLLVEKIKSAGYEEVVDFGNGLAAIRELGKIKDNGGLYALVTDFNLKGQTVNGCDVAEIAREIFPENKTKIIFFTGSSVERCASKVSAFCISKPYSDGVIECLGNL